MDPVLVGGGGNVDAQIQVQLPCLQQFVQIGAVSTDQFNGDVFVVGIIIFPDIREKHLTAQSGDPNLKVPRQLVEMSEKAASIFLSESKICFP